MTELVQISETRPVSGERTIDSHPALYQRFITWVSVTKPPHLSAWVDSFGFLYSFLREIYQLKDGNEIFADIGEELTMSAKLKNGLWQVSINCNGDPETTWELSSTEFLWSLVNTVHQLTTSMRNAGIDVDSYVKEYPPPLVSPDYMDPHWKAERPSGNAIEFSVHHSFKDGE